MLVCGNQQETSWFSGILDGEGSCYNNKNHAYIRITNTDIDIINACVNYLKMKMISYVITEQVHRNRPTSKKVYNVCIHGVNNCYTLIKYLDDSFQCRRQEFLDKLKLGSPTTTRDATLTSDLNWLVGITEAEGCLCLHENKSPTYYPSIGIKNTKVSIIDKIVKTLHANGLSWHVGKYNNKNPNQLPVYQLKISGMLRVQRFLRKTEGLWVSNRYRNRAVLIGEYIESRFSKPQKDPLSKREDDIFRLLKLKI